MCTGEIMSEGRMVLSKGGSVGFSEVSACAFFHHPVENPVDTVHNSWLCLCRIAIMSPWWDEKCRKNEEMVSKW